MSPEIKKAIAETAERELPLFDLLDMKYINLSESFFTPKGEDWLRDGKVYFKFDRSKIPDDKLKLISHNIMRDYVRDKLIYPDDEFCIIYDTEDKLAEGMEDKEKGGISAFAIRRSDKIYRECGGTIASVLMYMDSLKHPKLEETKEKVNKFAFECYVWIKEQIRHKFFAGVKGTFCIDNIQSDTYYQRRNTDSDNIYDYIIHDWCRRMCDNKPITWIDFMGEDKVYIALD